MIVERGILQRLGRILLVALGAALFLALALAFLCAFTFAVGEASIAILQGPSRLRLRFEEYLSRADNAEEREVAPAENGQPRDLSSILEDSLVGGQASEQDFSSIAREILSTPANPFPTLPPEKANDFLRYTDAEGVPATEFSGQCRIYLAGNSTVGPGPANIPLQYFIGGSDIRVLARVVNTDPEAAEHFASAWEDAVADYLRRRAKEDFGDCLEEMDFARVTYMKNTAYLLSLSLKLPEASGAEEEKMDVVIAFRFGKNYSVEFIGLAPKGAAELQDVIAEAALLFEDTSPADTTAPPAMYSTGAFEKNVGEWSLPTNPVFAVVREAIDHPFPGDVPRAAED